MLEPSVPDFSLADRRAIVTGASRGIGQALAIGLALLDRRLRSRQPLGLLQALPSMEACRFVIFIMFVLILV